ncbi:Beta-xylosidase [Acidisarcina polymorpha]|uniref:Beta-xylosidase n=1 Tax=Acidisarcina polymorpha TaxID=2211140 RepID=A0A2Z5G3T6_9BACT|nr:beta-xylosidase [Acidisarcina polymorpha]AXC13739.1 Beta-xylosidase [Acidisarcina polymorpha]
MRNRSSETRLLVCVAMMLGSCLLHGQRNTPPSVEVRVDASATDGILPRAWSYFGYDEPNFTESENGRKLLKELAALSPVPVYIRTHNLLTSGDGKGSLKWGSTNAYSEDANGKPVYDWKIVDRIFDDYRDAGVRPLVEIGFMPEAMTTGPPPYRHSFPQGSVFTGWSYPPKDYEKWGELVFRFAQHLRQRYGDAAVKTWLWEVWNEPDIGYWHGTPEEYFKLYDYSAAAVLRAVPFARVGGPESTGPANDKAAAFLRAFLEHCSHGTNSATGKTGAPLAFISFHPKGSPKWLGDHVQMGLSNQLAAVDRGFKIVADFPEWRKTPIIMGEWDPEGCAACSAKGNPQNGYRNGPLYATYTALAYKSTMELAREDGVNFAGAVTWAFQFDNQPYFEGLRELATNGLDKPVLNSFRMLGLLSESRYAVNSDAAIPARQIEASGVRSLPDIDALATGKDREVEVLLLNYHDDDLPGSDANVRLSVDRLPEDARRVLVEVFRVDSSHSNSFNAWQRLGSPQQPTPEQYRSLEAAGQLQLESSPFWMTVDPDGLHLPLSLPANALALVRISW